MGYQLRWLERTPDKGEVPGSSPGWPTYQTVFSYAEAKLIYGGIAQLVERLLCKQDVSGSSPLTSTKTIFEIELASASWLMMLNAERDFSKAP